MVLDMFLNVMMHSISSPAYTLGSLHCTYARILDGAVAGGILLEARAVDLVRASLLIGHAHVLEEITSVVNEDTEA